MEHTTRSSAQDFFSRGSDAYERGDYTTAIAALSDALALRPDWTDAYFLRGLACYANEDLSDAQNEVLQELLETAPHLGATTAKD